MGTGELTSTSGHMPWDRFMEVCHFRTRTFRKECLRTESEISENAKVLTSLGKEGVEEVAFPVPDV